MIDRPGRPAGSPLRSAPTSSRRRAGSRTPADAARIVLASLLLWLALALAPAIGLAQTQGAPEVFGVRFGVNGDITRVVLDLDRPASFATRILSGPPRLAIELDAVRWRVRDHPQGRLVGLARSVDYGHLESGRGRLVVEIGRPFRIARAERLPPSGDTPHHRILVDVVALPPATAAPPAVAAAPAATPRPAAPVVQGTPQRDATPPGRPRQPPAAAGRPPPVTAAAPPRPPRIGPPRPRPGNIATADGAAATPPATPDDTTTEPAAIADADANGDERPPARLPLPGVTAPDGVLAGAATAAADEAGVPRTSSADTVLPPVVPPAAPDDAGAAGETVDIALGPVLQAPPLPQRRRIIALDPGHGGADPGTVGINGVLEKDVTLDLARRLRTLIEATGRYEVVLTRDDDVFVSLRDRIERARRSEAAIFISIHADSIGNPKLRGASVYTLSDQASDAEAARLATKENRADVIAGTDLSAHDEIVAGILIDLAQRVTNNKSIEFADVLTAELGDVTALVRNTRRFAGFVVLKSPDVPSVLLELGYLSNPTDAANLAKPEYRDRLARATLRAIDRYFAEADATL